MIGHHNTDCPVCGGVRAATVKEYDYGTSPETGYHDAGRILTCATCEVELRDEEIDRAFEKLRAF